MDAGCRFGKDCVPEYIDFTEKNMARTFIDTLEEGLRLSRTDVISKEEFKDLQKEERKELAEKIENAKSEANVETTAVSDTDKQALVDKLQANIGKLDVAKMKGIIVKYGIDFKNIATISDEAYNELKELV